MQLDKDLTEIYNVLIYGTAKFHLNYYYKANHETVVLHKPYSYSMEPQQKNDHDTVEKHQFQYKFFDVSENDFGSYIVTAENRVGHDIYQFSIIKYISK